MDNRISFFYRNIAVADNYIQVCNLDVVQKNGVRKSLKTGQDLQSHKSRKTKDGR
jgi:hypothetical protein